MNQKQMKNILFAMKGITYEDWFKIKVSIDREFESEIGELKSKIKLTDLEKIENLIHSQFG